MASVQGVKISIPEMQAFRGKVDQDNETIRTQLGAVKQSMDYLHGTEIWKSEGGDEIQRKFTELYPRFDKFYNTVRDYIEFLDRTMEKYDVTESAVVADTRTVSDWK
ncbi:MAG: WXG100 family type VII secretion target [Ruminococcus sp.]